MTHARPQPSHLSATHAPLYAGVHLLSVLCHLVLARFFAAFRIWQVFRLVPTPAILPMSLSRLTVDINAVGMFTGHTATGLPGIRTRFPFQQRVRLSPNPPQNYSFAPKQKNKLRKFFRYSRNK